MTSTRTAILNNANMNFAAAVAAENARATQETTDFNNQLLDATTAAQASIDAALTAEPSRADAFCDSSMTGVILTNSTGNTNDYASCSVVGQVYYSQGSVGIFTCEGTFFNAFPSGGFADSTTLQSRTQTKLMIGTFGSRWVNCYRASRDGFNGYQFHANCNYRGSTVFIGRVSGSNRVFGGYTDRPWASSNMQTHTSNSLLFRFEPSTNNINLLNVQSYSSQQYAMYDYFTYGPCFGSSGDIYVTSGGVTVYACPNYYSVLNAGGLNVQLQTTTSSVCGTTITQTTTSPISVATPWSGYDCNTLLGTSGTSMSDWEVYYMV